MFRGIEYYERISKELEEIIDIYESSYKGFETAVLRVVESGHPIKSKEQKKIHDEFVEFCQNEGIDYNQGKGKYKNMVDAVKERIEFLKEKKEINDKLLEALKKIEDLKDDKISKETKRVIIEEAEKKYDKGSDKFKRFVRKRIQEEKEKELEKYNEQLKTAKTDNKCFKRKNGWANIATNVLGPFGNPVYNAWATVRNANTRLRKKHPFINGVVKVGMLLGSVALASTLTLGVTATLIAGFGIIGATINTARHIINYKDVPPIVEKRRVPNGYVNGIKDAWFRFRKSRGNTKISVQEKLYSGIDMEKYEAKSPESEGMSEGEDEKGKGVGSKVGKAPKPAPAPVEAEEEATPAPVETEEEAHEEEAREEETAPAPAETEEEAHEEEAREEETAPAPAETEEAHEEEAREEETAPAPVEAEREETKYAITELEEWKDLKRTRELLVDKRAKSSDLTEIEKYTAEINRINKLLKSVSPDVQRQIDTIQNARQTFEQAEFNEKATETGLPLNGAYKEARLREFESLREFIQNAPYDQEVYDKVQFVIRHYKLNNKQLDELMRLVFESLREFIQNAPSDQEVEDKVQFAIQHYKLNREQLIELMRLVLERKNVSKESASGRGK